MTNREEKYVFSEKKNCTLQLQDNSSARKNCLTFKSCDIFRTLCSTKPFVYDWMVLIRNPFTNCKSNLLKSKKSFSPPKTNFWSISSYERMVKRGWTSWDGFVVWPQAAAWLDGWFLVGFVMAAVVVLDTFTPTDFGRWSKAFKLPLCMHYCTGYSEKIGVCFKLYCIQGVRSNFSGKM